MDTKQYKNIYFQLWRNPVFYGRLFKIMKPTDWQTFCGLAMFMNGDNECNPSLKTLTGLLGLSDIGTTSRRITRLEKLRFEGLPILQVRRRAKFNSRGTPQFENNHYILNKNILSVFEPHASTLVRQEQQMEEIKQMKQKTMEHLAYSPNGKQTT